MPQLRAVVGSTEDRDVSCESGLINMVLPTVNRSRPT